MTAMSSYGYLRKTRHYIEHMAKIHKTRKRHGESKQCVDHRVLKYTTWHGHRTVSFSSQAAWTTLLGYTMLQMVGQEIEHEHGCILTCSGNVVRQIAEHNHYVQGVAWDPLNEYIATQSSDRSVHIYTLKTKDGQFTLANHNKITKMDMPHRRISSNSPAPPEFRGRASFVSESPAERAIASPTPSAPGTPQSLALPMPMNPPPTSHSRRSSFGSTTHSMRRSVSPSPSLPLPAVMPAASPHISSGMPLQPARSTSLYANETFTSFFRRLTFAPDGSLLFTPAGQQKESSSNHVDSSKPEDVANMTFIYTRAGLNKPPVARLPGHKKPSLAVRCNPIYFNLRSAPTSTKEITIDTSNDGEADLAPLPEPLRATRPPHTPNPSSYSMDPPPPFSAPSPAPSSTTAQSPRPHADVDGHSIAGPVPVFDLPYRIVYAVATQDAVHVYDTQQKLPLCVVSNLHYATFTDLAWSADGLTLVITSSDGFCSCLTFNPGELGSTYVAPSQNRHAIAPINTAIPSGHSTPVQTPTQPSMPQLTRPPSSHGVGPSPSPFPMQPASPARSLSISSVTTQESHLHGLDGANSEMNRMTSSATPQISSVPSITAANTGTSVSGLIMFTPPQTPGASVAVPAASVQPLAATGTKREAEAVGETTGKDKKRRIQPTLVTAADQSEGPSSA